MRSTVVRCDRCSEVVREGVSILACNAGLLAASHGGGIDLCRDCGDSFKGWLNEARPGCGQEAGSVDLGCVRDEIEVL